MTTVSYSRPSPYLRDLFVYSKSRPCLTFCRLISLQMSYCREEGKDKIIFVTEEDHAKPPNITVPEYEDEPGLILPNGEINWNCPCLGGMATGPCGYEFRESFSCVRNSEAEVKGSDCFEQFKAMIDCFKKYPDVYGNNDDDVEDPLKVDDNVESKDDRVESKDENADSDKNRNAELEDDQSISKSDTTRSSDT